MEVSLYPELPVQHFDLTLFQVDDADWLFGVLTLIVLQHIRITAHATSPEHKPAFPPRLQEKQIVRELLLSLTVILTLN